MRTISPTLINILAANQVEDMYYAVELLFDSGALRLWTGVGNRTLGGNVYTGTGTLLTISPMEETSDLSVNGASITLSGIDSNLVSLALTEPYQNRIGRVYLGSGSEMFELFSGYMDVMFIQDTGETFTITMNIESRLIVLEKVVPIRYTQESQASRYPTDTFFSYVADLSDKQIAWGRSS